MTGMSANQPNCCMTRIKQLWKPAALGLACALWSSIAGANNHILMVLSSDAPVYGEIFNSFNTELSESLINTGTEINSVTLNPKTGTTSPAFDLQRPSLIIAVGSKAATYIDTARVSAVVLSVFITQDSWHKMQMESQFQENQTAIYLDQPYQRFTQLCSLLPVNVRSLGAVFGPLSLDKFKTLEHFSDAKGLRLNARLLHKNDNPIAVLEPLFTKSDLFLALPDESVFNQSIAKWILVLGIKYKIPVVGFSRAYTDAGALAALHSTPQDTGKDTAHWVKQWLRNPGQALPPPRFNRIFTLSTNPQVALSLGIAELNTESLQQSLIKLEQGNTLLNASQNTDTP